MSVQSASPSFFRGIESESPFPIANERTLGKRKINVVPEGLNRTPRPAAVRAEAPLNNRLYLRSSSAESANLQEAEDYLRNRIQDPAHFVPLSELQVADRLREMKDGTYAVSLGDSMGTYKLVCVDSEGSDRVFRAADFEIKEGFIACKGDDCPDLLFTSFDKFLGLFNPLFLKLQAIHEPLNFRSEVQEGIQKPTPNKNIRLNLLSQKI